MKKNIVLSILAIAVIAGIGFFAIKNKDSFSGKGKAGKSTSEASGKITTKDVSLLAEETDVCFILSDLSAVINNIKNSAFGKEFKTLPIWNYLDVEKNLAEITGSFAETLGTTITQDQLFAVLGKKVVLGIDITDNIPVITVVANVETPVIDFIKSMFNKPENKDTLVKEVYQDQEIYFLSSTTPEQPNVSFVAFDNSQVILTMGGTIANTKAAIERKSGLKKSLISNEVITTMLKNDFKGEGFFFINLDTISNIPSAPGTVTAVGGDMLKYIIGEVFFTDGLNMNLKIYPNKNKMTPEIQDMWFVDPKKISVLNYAPAGTLFFTGSTQMNFEQLFNSWQEGLKAQDSEVTKSILDSITNLKETNGIDIAKEVIPNIGNEMAVVCSAIEAKGLMPLIEVGFVVEVLNKNIIKKNLDAAIKVIEAAIISQAGEQGLETANVFKVETTSYSDVEIFQIKLPFMVGQAISPCYAFVDKYLVISTSTSGLEKIIDVRSGKINSLKGSGSFGLVKDIYPEETNQMGFVDIVKVLDSAVSLSEWLISFQKLSVPQGDTPEAIAQRQEAQQTEILIRDNLIPLLKTMKVIKVIGANTINEGNKEYVKQSFRMVIEDKVQAA